MDRKKNQLILLKSGNQFWNNTIFNLINVGWNKWLLQNTNLSSPLVAKGVCPDWGKESSCVHSKHIINMYFCYEIDFYLLPTQSYSSNTLQHFVLCVY